MGLEWQQLLEAKMPQLARRHAAGDLRGFDGDGATAAAGVVKRGLAVPAAGRKHRGGQGFLERCIALVGAPAALEQGLARGVDVERELVLRQVRKDTGIRPAGFDVGAHAGLVAETVDQRVLDLQCGEVQALERAVLGRDLDLEALLGREPDFPGHIGSGVVQVLLAAVGRGRQVHQHALRQAAVQVQQQRVAPGTFDQHAAAPGARCGAGDALDLGGQEFLDAGGARQKQLEFVHGSCFKAPCAGWRGRCAAPRGIWRRCGARIRCPAP